MTIHTGDIGTRLRFRFTELNDAGVVVAVDISGAIAKQCFLRRPDGTVATRTLTLTSGGVDGLAHYDTVDGDVPTGSAGAWSAQGKVQLSSGIWHADIVNFPVRANLS